MDKGKTNSMIESVYSLVVTFNIAHRVRFYCVSITLRSGSLLYLALCVSPHAEPHKPSIIQEKCCRQKWKIRNLQFNVTTEKVRA